MNYLAHLLVSPPDPESQVGSILGDFARGVDLSRYPPRIQASVALHFRVDAFTDAHEVFRESRSRIRPPHRRYAGVLIDMFYDHFLAREFERYSAVPLEAFVSRAYASLESHRPVLPEPMSRACGAMIAGDWLGSYRDVEGIETALRRMSRRLTRENRLASAAEELVADYDRLRGDFHRFFPELLRFAGGFRWRPAAAPGSGAGLPDFSLPSGGQASS